MPNLNVEETPCFGMAWTFSTTIRSTRMSVRARVHDGVEHAVDGAEVIDEHRRVVTEDGDGGVHGAGIDGGEDHLFSPVIRGGRKPATIHPISQPRK